MSVLLIMEKVNTITKKINFGISKNYGSYQLLLPDCRPITYFEQIYAEIWSK